MATLEHLLAREIAAWAVAGLTTALRAGKMFTLQNASLFAWNTGFAANVVAL
jgi:hypothetical protein